MKKKTKDKKLLFAAAGLVLVAVVVLLVLFGQGKGEEEPAQDAMDLGQGISLVEVRRYSGMYLEDGSDTIVQDVLAILVENTGEEAVQLATVELHTVDGQLYTFEFTTLLPGEQMLVLEKNRAAYDPTLQVVYAMTNGVAIFAEEPSMHSDVLELSTSDGAITVKNVSGDDFAGGRVFYKNVSGDLLIGGITYMATVPALQEGQEVTLSAVHYTDSGSRLMFVTYAE